MKQKQPPTQSQVSEIVERAKKAVTHAQTELSSIALGCVPSQSTEGTPTASEVCDHKEKTAAENDLTQEESDDSVEVPKNFPRPCSPSDSDSFHIDFDIPFPSTDVFPGLKEVRKVSQFTGFAISQPKTTSLWIPILQNWKQYTPQQIVLMFRSHYKTQSSITAMLSRFKKSLQSLKNPPPKAYLRDIRKSLIWNDSCPCFHQTPNLQ